MKSSAADRSMELRPDKGVASHGIVRGISFPEFPACGYALARRASVPPAGFSVIELFWWWRRCFDRALSFSGTSGFLSRRPPWGDEALSASSTQNRGSSRAKLFTCFADLISRLPR